MNTCELCDKRIRRGKVYCDECQDGLDENEACDNPAVAPAPSPAAGVIDLSPAAEAAAFLGKAFGW